jgi:hypothetical protein
MVTVFRLTQVPINDRTLPKDHALLPDMRPTSSDPCEVQMHTAVAVAEVTWKIKFAV